jgi:hypothetical protein
VRGGLGERGEPVGDDRLRPAVDLLLGVAARDVAGGAQPEVAVVVAVGRVRALVLAAVELDDDAAVGP